MRRRRPFPLRGRNHRGFTLVELVVAILVITIGVIGLASTAGAVTRQMGGGRRMLIASSVARARLEWFAAQNCTTVTTGSATTRGIAETWTVTQGARSVSVQLSVTYATPRGNRSQSYSARIPCRQLTLP
jgi:prepilin-type N-terminal cleavage/methylation domain-containing protein